MRSKPKDKKNKTTQYNVENIERFYLTTCTNINYERESKTKSRSRLPIQADSSESTIIIKRRKNKHGDGRRTGTAVDEELGYALPLQPGESVPVWPHELDDSASAIIRRWTSGRKKGSAPENYEDKKSKPRPLKSILRKTLMDSREAAQGETETHTQQKKKSNESILKTRKEFRDTFQKVFEQPPLPQSYSWIFGRNHGNGAGTAAKIIMCGAVIIGLFSFYHHLKLSGVLL